jgi:hypothetical protein
MDYNVVEAHVSYTQNAHQSIHGFFVDKSSAYLLMASVSFDNHRRPPYSGIIQLHMWE